MKTENLGIIQIVIAAFLMGFIPIIVRIGDNLGPYNLSFFRVFIAAASILIYVLIAKKRFIPPITEKKKLLLFSAIHGFIILGYFVAIQFLSVASAVLLLYSSAIWIIVFSRVILKEKISSRTAISLGIAFLGVILVLSPQNFFLMESLIGSLSGLISGIGFGLVYVLSKTFKTYDKVSLTFWQNTIAILFLLPLLFIDPPKFSSFDILLVILLGSIFTAIPFILVYKGFEKISAQKGGVIILLDIIFPVILASIFFKEIPSITSIMGGVLLITGFYLATNQK